jgi:plastocyanin
MRPQFAVLLIVALICSSTHAGDKNTGTITGVIRHTGAVPPPRKVMATDGSPIEVRDLWVDAKSRGLRDVVVMLEDAERQPAIKDAKPILMDQRDMIFIPHVIAVQAGQAVVFGNNDLSNHSVMAVSPVPVDQFNIFVLPDKPIKHTFTAQKAPVLIGCSLHAWMRAWIYVVPHPWFAVTGDQGRFTIANVPPGNYTLWLRHADTSTQYRHKLEVKANGQAEVEIDWAAITK